MNILIDSMLQGGAVGRGAAQALHAPFPYRYKQEYINQSVQLGMVPVGA